MASKPRDRTQEMLARRAAPPTAAKPSPPLIEPERLDERGMRRQTLYLPPGVYEYIREMCHVRRCSQQKFFRDALDHYFKSIGGKGWDELEGAGRKPGKQP
jgi:hypothetical protein